MWFYKDKNNMKANEFMDKYSKKWYKRKWASGDYLARRVDKIDTKKDDIYRFDDVGQWVCWITHFATLYEINEPLENRPPKVM